MKKNEKQKKMKKNENKITSTNFNTKKWAFLN
jgi:hypothetical protein